jgi:hypothetical protein
VTTYSFIDGGGYPYKASKGVILLKCDKWCCTTILQDVANCSTVTNDHSQNSLGILQGIYLPLWFVHLSRGWYEVLMVNVVPTWWNNSFQKLLVNLGSLSLT